MRKKYFSIILFFLVVIILASLVIALNHPVKGETPQCTSNTIKYEYITTNTVGNPYGPAVNCSTTLPAGGGWTLRSRQCLWSSEYTSCFRDLCLWRKPSVSNLEYKFTNCKDSIETNYQLKSSACISVNNDPRANCPASSPNVCLWERPGTPSDLTLTHDVFDLPGGLTDEARCDTQSAVAGFSFVGRSCVLTDARGSGVNFDCRSDVCLFKAPCVEPIGYLDQIINCQKIIGWTCDPDKFDQSLIVHLYNGINAPTNLIGSTVANVSRESAVAAQCGGNANHGFEFTVPVGLIGGRNHKIFAYGINIDRGTKDTHLTNSPLNFQCNSPECDDGIDNDDDKGIDALVESQELNVIKTTANFYGYNNGWDAQEDACQEPILALSGLTEGQIINGTNISGTWSRRIYNGVDLGPETCRDSGYGTFVSKSNTRTIARYTLKEFEKGIPVPKGASRLYVHIMDGADACNDNSGYRDNRPPCSVIFVTTTIKSECNDGKDNDNDGLIDLNDLGCASPKDNSEIQHDLQCDNPNDDDESIYQACPDNQTIMKLSSVTNSHGSLWDATNLSLTFERVCFNQIFGKNFTDTGNPHQCTGINKVLGLFESKNSLAEIPENNNYLINICYGDLSCRSVDISKGENCSSDEKTVVSLLNKTNSYLALRNDSNYPIKICCRSGLDINGSSWRNMKDEPINKSDLNDLVKLDVRGKGFESNIIDYRIFKEDGGFLFFDKKIAETSSRGFLKIRVGPSNNFTNGKYYFKAKIGAREFDSRKKSDNTNNPFGILKVSDIENNSMPIANIITPEDKGIYFVNEQLRFTQNSYDEDDEISYEWNLDQEIKIGNSVNLDNYNFNYSYNLSGQKNIKLKVTDDRGNFARDEHSILIINTDLNPSQAEKYIFAYIDKPKFGEAFGKLVDFDATSSYSIMIKDQLITCVAGKCPSKTSGCPTGYNYPCPINVLNISPTPDYNPINFSWIFDDNINENFSAKGLAGAVFKKTFVRIGNHIAKLTVSINPRSSTETSFNVFFSNDTCFVIRDERDKKFISGSLIGESYWVNPSVTSFNSINNCYNREGVDRNGDLKTECCPFGYTCNNASSPAKCIFEPRDRCEDFTTQNDCLDDDGHSTMAIKELDPIIDKGKFVGGCEGFNEPYGNLCYQYLSCKCEWNAKNNTCNPVSRHKVSHVTTNKIQNFDYDNLPSNISSICNSQGEPTTGKCVFDFTYSGSCLDGDEFIIRSWTAFFETNAASANNPDYCVDGSDSIPCERVVKLEFFNFVNLIITILTLVTIYFLLHKNKLVKIK